VGQKVVSVKIWKEYVMFMAGKVVFLEELIKLLFLLNFHWQESGVILHPESPYSGVNMVHVLYHIGF
jgi:hypothetical protein